MGQLQPEEVKLTLACMLTGKAPGTDGLTVAFYKVYQDILIPHLVTLFEEMATDGSMPLSMREALLVVLLKPGKPVDHCSSYRHNCPL
ncbi:hypothetical protein NDU88_011170 [Pleurodeles waltl]|uniref:Uncharacterized protein n=1 Tax=Pleurodeles waltl TaxID=8319 RepID=A0AAV7S3B8_PLEWA|nr:hypothetical protein NDU88_011170 [Pleurodeles waltl]